MITKFLVLAGILACTTFNNGDVVKTYVEETIDLRSEVHEGISDLYCEYGKEVYEGRFSVVKPTFDFSKNGQQLDVTYSLVIEGDVYEFGGSAYWDFGSESWEETSCSIYSYRDARWFNESNVEQLNDLLAKRASWFDEF